MRPAQKAPENRERQRFLEAVPTHFNEAGAKSAGKLIDTSKSLTRMTNFNEAGAKSAGKPLAGLDQAALDALLQ